MAMAKKVTATEAETPQNAPTTPEPAVTAYKGFNRDWTCRGFQYEVGKRMRGKSSARAGVHKPLTRRYLDSLGWRWCPTMKIGQGCKVHLRSDELPRGRLIVAVSRHLCAVIDGVLRDTHDASRGGTRCVYGYWSAP